MSAARIERVVVLGAGAVGGAVGGLLFASGTPVVLIARGAHLDALADDGLELALPDRTYRLEVPTAASPAAVDWRPGDVCLWCTKLNDAEAALDALLAAAGPDLPVAALVNGVRGEALVAARFRSALSTLVWLPATHLEPGRVRLHSAGSLGVLDSGPATSAPSEALLALAAELCERFGRAGFDAVVRLDIERWKRAKWLTNLGGTAQALVTDDWRAVARAARAEGEAVLAAAGLEHVPVAELLARCGAVELAPVGGREREGGSTWQSHVRGRPLETPWIEAALAELAREHGLDAPVNRALAEAARAPRARRAAEFLSA